MNSSTTTHAPKPNQAPGFAQSFRISPQNWAKKRRTLAGGPAPGLAHDRVETLHFRSERAVAIPGGDGLGQALGPVRVAHGAGLVEALRAREKIGDHRDCDPRIRREQPAQQALVDLVIERYDLRHFEAGPACETPHLAPRVIALAEGFRAAVLGRLD